MATSVQFLREVLLIPGSTVVSRVFRKWYWKMITDNELGFHSL